MARSSSDCLLVADAGGDLIGYVWPQDPGAQLRQAETMRLCEASTIAVGIAPNVLSSRVGKLRGDAGEATRSTGLALYETGPWPEIRSRSASGTAPRNSVSPVSGSVTSTS